MQRFINYRVNINNPFALSRNGKKSEILVISYDLDLWSITVKFNRISKIVEWRN